MDGRVWRRSAGGWDGKEDIWRQPHLRRGSCRKCCQPVARIRPTMGILARIRSAPVQSTDLKGKPTLRSDPAVRSASPLVAMERPELLYFPKAVHDDLVAPWHPEQTLNLLRSQFLQRPAQAEPKPGRNDPCTCGSGRKSKQCHGK